MEPVSINVSEVRCAVVDEQWRSRFIRGEKPSTLSFSPPGKPVVHGQRFHSAANYLVKHLVESHEQADLTEKDIYQILVSQKEAEFALDLLNKGEAQQASIYLESLFYLARNVRKLKSEASNGSWKSIFLASEYSLENIKLEVGERLVFVSGAIDCLRRHPKNGIEIVDYKLTGAEEQAKSLIQVALYHKMLVASGAEPASSAVLEYYYPSFKALEIGSERLEEIYKDLIEPVLQQIVEARYSKDNTSSGEEPYPAPKKEVESQPRNTEAFHVNLGVSRGFKSESISLNSKLLKRHVAVLGGSGSGKTTLALNMIEQLLEKKIPVLLVDRKGDLCQYADPKLLDDRANSRRTQFLQSLDVKVYTPGHSDGCPLSIGVLPAKLPDSSAEREQSIKNAAFALAGMMGLRSSNTDRALVATLICCLRALVILEPDDKPSLELLIDVIKSGDQVLLDELDLDHRFLGKLLERLQTLKIMQGELLTTKAEPLSAESLLGINSSSGKTRLSIISTKFLGEKSVVLFWISQLLFELERYASRNPRDELQAAIMFDEADLYLPATSKPPTKEPMESLLKRARSAGMSIFLATQSPGDFDYKCRENVLSWFLGKVRENTGLEKLRAAMSEAKLDPAEVLPKQKVGQFYFLSEGKSVAIQASASLVKTDQLSEREILNLAKMSAGK